MAIALGTYVRFHANDTNVIRMTSDAERAAAVVDLDRLRGGTQPPAHLKPFWARYVAAVASLPSIRCHIRGGTGVVASTLPRGAGLSSSASLEIALALAFGYDLGATDPGEMVNENERGMLLARACQEAEHLATGVSCGVMDQIAITFGIADHALLIDFAQHPEPSIQPVLIPEDLEILVVQSATTRRLSNSAYEQRRLECVKAAAVVGPLASASVGDIAAIADPTIAARAHHVITECERVRDFVQALESGDYAAAGSAMTRSHHSLSLQFGVSTRDLDSLVEELSGNRHIYGARLTGAGFGGCVVALCQAGKVNPDDQSQPAWILRPAVGANLGSA